MNRTAAVSMFAVVIAFLGGCTRQAIITDARRAEHVASFDKVWQTIRDKHYDPTIGGVDWPGVRAELRPKIEAVRTDAEAEQVLADLTSRTKLSHFGILPPGREAKAAHSGFVPPIAKDAPDVKVKFGNLPPLPLRVSHVQLPQNISYFYLSIFLNPPKVMPVFRQAVEAGRDADGLIIDLRHNPGGVGVMAIGIGNQLVTQPDLKLGTMIQRDGELNFILNPQADPYVKPVAILIDGGSASTTEIFAQGLRDIGRARVFGTRSAGQALPSLVETLPNGYVFQYAVANYISTSGKTLESNGVMPDEIVENPKPGDAADPVIDAAIKWIKLQSEKTP